MISLARKAVQNGYRALFIKAQDLLDELVSRRSIYPPALEVTRQCRCSAIDELGYVNIKPEQTNIFFKLMEERHHRSDSDYHQSAYATWPDFLANPVCTKTVESPARALSHGHDRRPLYRLRPVDRSSVRPILRAHSPRQIT